MELQEGQIIGNKYRIIKLLGKGGMASVYEVEHLQLHVRRALKIFTVETDRAEMLRRRFEGEGKLLSKLDHPNLVKVHDLDFLDDGHSVYYVMDIIRCGDNLTRTLADIPPGEVEEDRALTWFADMCSALDYIHERGIVHRDIKLGNILLNADGHAVLTDFGISKVCNDGLRMEVDLERTITTGITTGETGGGFMWGTLGYIAPEVRSGKAADARSDTYSLAVAFFKLLTNVWYDVSLAPSSDATSGCSLNSVKLLEPMDYNWVGVLPKMLEEDRERRPERLADVVPAVSVKRHEERMAERHWPKWFWIVLGVLLIAGVSALAWWRLPVRESSLPDGRIQESLPVEDGLYTVPAALRKE